MMLGADRNELRRVTTETTPLGVLGDPLVRGIAQVPLDALLAEHIDAVRAAEDHSALATPTTEELTAILAALEFAAVVELMAGFAHGDLQDVVQTDLGHGGQRESKMFEAGGAVVLELGYRVYVRVDLVVLFEIFNGCFVVDKVLWKDKGGGR